MSSMAALASTVLLWGEGLRRRPLPTPHSRLKHSNLLTDADHFRIMKRPASLRSEIDRDQRGMLIGIIPES